MNTPLAVKAADGITKQSDVRSRDGEAGWNERDNELLMYCFGSQKVSKTYFFKVKWDGKDVPTRTGE